MRSMRTFATSACLSSDGETLKSDTHRKDAKDAKENEITGKQWAGRRVLEVVSRGRGTASHFQVLTARAHGEPRTNFQLVSSLSSASFASLQ